MYFDQQMHACACICRVENNQKHLKMINNILAAEPEAEADDIPIYNHANVCIIMNKIQVGGWVVE